jgi:hypothetical protein
MPSEAVYSARALYLPTPKAVPAAAAIMTADEAIIKPNFFIKITSYFHYTVQLLKKQEVLKKIFTCGGVPRSNRYRIS